MPVLKILVFRPCVCLPYEYTAFLHKSVIERVPFEVKIVHGIVEKVIEIVEKEW